MDKQQHTELISALKNIYSVLNEIKNQLRAGIRVANPSLCESADKLGALVKAVEQQQK